MLASKVFKLYEYQTQLNQQLKNNDFTRIINRDIPYDARMLLDDVFYMISTGRVLDPDSLHEVFRSRKHDNQVHSLQQSVDHMTKVAQAVLASCEN